MSQRMWIHQSKRISIWQGYGVSDRWKCTAGNNYLKIPTTVTVICSSQRNGEKLATQLSSCSQTRSSFSLSTVF